MATFRDTTNHDPGDESDSRFAWDVCPHCGIAYSGWKGYVTPVLSSVLSSVLNVVEASVFDEICDEVLKCCGHTHCIVKDRELAKKLAENLQYKLDRRHYDLLIKEAKERASSST